MAERIRLLFWADSFWPFIGGMETWAARFVVALRDRGFEITVVTSHTGLPLPDRDIFHDIPVHRFPLWSALKDQNPRAIMKARRAVERLRGETAPDCIHLNSCGPTTVFHLWTRHVAPAPTLFTLHGAWPDAYALPGSLLARALEGSEKIVTVSRATRDWILGFVPHLSEKMQLIYPAIDPLPDAAAVREPVLLCAGRLSREKGVDLAIRAFARIHDRFPRARLVIAGDGTEREALSRLAEKLDAAGAVDFVGWVNPRDIPSLMHRSAIVLVPSRQEGFGLTALEAAHAGRPVVGFTVGGLPEVVADNQTGLLAPPEDEEGLADRIAFLLEHPDIGRNLGEAARARARRLFTWKTHMDRYENELRKLSGSVKRCA